MINKKQFPEKIILLIVSAVLVFAARKLGISCIMLYFTGIPCPGCGITRACLAALRLDFAQAFLFNPMFWSVPVLLVYFFCDGRVFKNKVIDVCLLCGIGTGFLANWLIKLLILFR